MSDKRWPRRPLPFPHRLGSGRPQSGTLPDPEPDPGLRDLLQRLPIPPASEELDARIMASYRREVARASARGGRTSTLFGALDTSRHKGPRWPVAALIAAGLFGALLVGALQITSSHVSAAELLEHARKQEQEWTDSPTRVVHRTLELEERRAADARVLTRRRIEIWHSAASGVQARRVYDERDRLVAGEWRHRDGSSTLYRPHARPAATRAPKRPPLDAHEIWRWDLTATQFAQLLATPQAAAVRRDGDTYVVAMALDADAGIAGATLTLDANDFRAREASIVVEQPDGAREYRLVEVTFEALPPAEVSPQRFEPDAELLVTPAPLEAIASRAAPAETPSAPIFSDTELDRLELYATYRLHRLANCVGPSTGFTRTPGGVQVEAPVVSDACHAEASSVFSTVMPGLHVTITTEENRSEPRATVALAPADVPRTPSYPALHAYFGKAVGAQPDGPATIDETVRQAIHQTATWSIARSEESVRHVQSLTRLSDRWSPDTLKPLDLEAVAMWQAMVRDEARAVAQAAETLRLQLQAPFLLAPQTPSESDAISIRDAGDVAAAVERLAALVHASDELTRQLFTPTAEGAIASSTDPSALAQMLLRTQEQAARFAEPWVLNP